MNIIVAVDQNWAIGYQGELLIRISEDMKYFKKMTMNCNVIMGRKTFESLPGKKPLKDRLNIVLTRDDNFFANNVCVCRNIKDAIEICTNNNQQTFVIGGQEIYQLFLPHCDKAYITKIYSKFTADKYFPNLDTMPLWSITKESDVLTTSDGINYQFIEYKKT